MLPPGAVRWITPLLCKACSPRSPAKGYPQPASPSSTGSWPLRTTSPPALRVAFLEVRLDILRDLDRKGRHQHPPRSLSSQLVHRRRGAVFLYNLLGCLSLSSTFSMGGVSFPRPASRSVCVSHGRIRRLLTLPIHNFWLYLWLPRRRICVLFHQDPPVPIVCETTSLMRLV